MPVPNFRSTPATLQRARSLPGLGGGRNQAAVGVGAAVTSVPQSASPAQSLGPYPGFQNSPDAGADRLKRMVSIANAEANQHMMPTEQDMIMDEMNDQDGYGMPADQDGYGW